MIGKRVTKYKICSLFRKSLFVFTLNASYETTKINGKRLHSKSKSKNLKINTNIQQIAKHHGIITVTS